jgi:hypothetical protein
MISSAKARNGVQSGPFSLHKPLQVRLVCVSVRRKIFGHNRKSRFRNSCNCSDLL